MGGIGENDIKRRHVQVPLVIQWLRIHPPTQETRFDPCSGKIAHAAEQQRPVLRNP